MADLPLLENPAEELDISKELKEFMQKSGFLNLDQMLQYYVRDLLKMDGFNFRLLKELYQLLEKNGLTEMLKE